MIPISLDFHIQKAYERTEFLYMYKSFAVPWIFLSGTPYVDMSRLFFFYSSKTKL